MCDVKEFELLDQVIFVGKRNKLMQFTKESLEFFNDSIGRVGYICGRSVCPHVYDVRWEDDNSISKGVYISSLVLFDVFDTTLLNLHKLFICRNKKNKFYTTVKVMYVDGIGGSNPQYSGMIGVIKNRELSYEDINPNSFLNGINVENFYLYDHVEVEWALPSKLKSSYVNINNLRLLDLNNPEQLALSRWYLFNASNFNV